MFSGWNISVMMMLVLLLYINYVIKGKNETIMLFTIILFMYIVYLNKRRTKENLDSSKNDEASDTKAVVTEAATDTKEVVTEAATDAKDAVIDAATDIRDAVKNAIKDTNVDTNTDTKEVQENTPGLKNDNNISVTTTSEVEKDELIQKGDNPVSRFKSSIKSIEKVLLELNPESKNQKLYKNLEFYEKLQDVVRDDYLALNKLFDTTELNFNLVTEILIAYDINNTTISKKLIEKYKSKIVSQIMKTLYGSRDPDTFCDKINSMKKVSIKKNDNSTKKDNTKNTKDSRKTKNTDDRTNTKNNENEEPPL